MQFSFDTPSVETWNSDTCNKCINYQQIVEINVNDKKYFAFKDVLINTCDYYDRYFNSKFNKNEMDSFEINPDVDFNIILHILTLHFNKILFDGHFDMDTKNIH